MPGTKHVEAMIVSRESTAGRMTRTCEDAAGQERTNTDQGPATSDHVSSAYHARLGRH